MSLSRRLFYRIVSGVSDRFGIQIFDDIVEGGWNLITKEIYFVGPDQTLEIYSSIAVVVVIRQAMFMGADIMGILKHVLTFREIKYNKSK